MGSGIRVSGFGFYKGLGLSGGFQFRVYSSLGCTGMWLRSLT